MSLPSASSVTSRALLLSHKMEAHKRVIHLLHAEQGTAEPSVNFDPKLRAYCLCKLNGSRSCQCLQLFLTYHPPNQPHPRRKCLQAYIWSFQKDANTLKRLLVARQAMPRTVYVNSIVQVEKGLFATVMLVCSTNKTFRQCLLSLLMNYDSGNAPFSTSLFTCLFCANYYYYFIFKIDLMKFVNFNAPKFKKDFNISCFMSCNPPTTTTF